MTIFHKFKKKPHKYNAKATCVDGVRFDSKKEANYYVQLKSRIANGEILFCLRQAPIHLPGNIRMVIDFIEFHSSGEVIFSDVKGIKTEAYEIKKKQIEALYPFKINEV